MQGQPKYFGKLPRLQTAIEALDIGRSGARRQGAIANVFA